MVSFRFPTVNRLIATDVVAVELLRVRALLRAPHRAGHGVEAVRDLVLVRAELGDGSEGWGECSSLATPSYTAEFSAAAWLVLRDFLAPALLAGSEPEVVGHPMASHALATAVLDARLRRSSRRLVDHLAADQGRPLGSVMRTAVIGRRDSVDDVLAAVAGRVADGVAMVKLKVTSHPVDLDSVVAVREGWPDLALAVDGNGTLDDRSLTRLAPLGLAYVEQPLAPADLLGHAAVARRHGLAVALDESIDSVHTLDAAAALGAVQVVNVKPARLGGLRPAMEVARRAVELGCGTFVGGMVESGVGRAAALALAAQTWATLPTDLGPSADYLATEVTDPIVADADGRLVVPGGAGVGVDVLEGPLAEVTTERVWVYR